MSVNTGLTVYLCCTSSLYQDIFYISQNITVYTRHLKAAISV